jgi:hypothetical protein
MTLENALKEIETAERNLTRPYGARSREGRRKQLAARRRRLQLAHAAYAAALVFANTTYVGVGNIDITSILAWVHTTHPAALADKKVQEAFHVTHLFHWAGAAKEVLEKKYRHAAQLFPHNGESFSYQILQVAFNRDILALLVKRVDHDLPAENTFLHITVGLSAKPPKGVTAASSSSLLELLCASPAERAKMTKNIFFGRADNNILEFPADLSVVTGTLIFVPKTEKPITPAAAGGGAAAGAAANKSASTSPA